MGTLSWFQENRVKMDVVDRFYSMHQEVPRWKSSSPMNCLNVFCVVCGAAWLVANSTEFNDFQRITKGTGESVKRNKAEWHKYMSGEPVSWMPSLSDEQMIQIAFPRLVTQQAAPTVLDCAPLKPALSSI